MGIPVRGTLNNQDITQSVNPFLIPGKLPHISNKKGDIKVRIFIMDSIGICPGAFHGYSADPRICVGSFKNHIQHFLFSAHTKPPYPIYPCHSPAAFWTLESLTARIVEIACD